MAAADDHVHPGRFGTGLPLHRIIWAVGALLALLAGSAALTALAGIRATASSTATIQTRQAWRQLLDVAQHDIATGQLQLMKAVSQQPAHSISGLPVAIQRRQDGLRGWRLYKSTLAGAGVALPGLSRVDSDLRDIQAFDLAPPGRSGAQGTAERANGTSSSPNSFRRKSTSAGATSLARLDADFSAVRVADDRWWAASAIRERARAHSAAIRLLAVTGAALLLGCAVIGFTARAAGRRDRDLAQRDNELRKAASANELEARLQRALEMASTEVGVYDIVEQSLREALPSLRTELLVADSSRAHFQQILSTGLEMDHHCGVASPAQCPATQRGQILSFSSSNALDTCSYLKAASPEPRSATCLPVSIAGMTYGVVHAAGHEDQLPSAEDRATLELIARRASDRLGMMRAMTRSELQASTDSLTGLPNRRTLESQVHDLSAREVDYAVAFADLDHFKLLNDTHGHGAGDRALRLFAEVLRENLRPMDLVGRYGGEEFVIVLPNCPQDEALRVLDRIRYRLAARVAAVGTPSFTVSIGLDVLDGHGEFFERVATADTALRQAKREGRDRVVVATPEHAGSVAV